MPGIPLEKILERAKENCERQGRSWRPDAGKAKGKTQKDRPVISESAKRSYILDAEQQLLRKEDENV